jgi:Sortilin, neurotensin receptor 3,/BNR/Asp-box repeat
VLALLLLLLLLAPRAEAGLPEGAGVYRSEDGGRTWTQLTTSPPIDGVFALVVDPTTPTRLVLASDRSLWLSEDAGGEWRRASVPAAAADVAAFALAVDPTRPARLWAGTEAGLLRSDDGGSTWTLIGDLPPPTALAVGLGQAGPRLYAGASDGLRVSDDGGQTWFADGAGLEGGVLALAVDEAGEMVVGTTVGVFVRASDGEELMPARGLPKGASRAAAFRPDGSALSTVIHQLYTRAGGGWQKLATLPLATNGDLPTITALLPLDDGRLLLGTEHGLHSSDGWKLVPPFDGLTNLEVAALAIDSSRPERIYLGASSIPNAVALGRVGVLFTTAAVNEAPDARFEVAVAAIFLVGGVLAVRYLSRPTAAPS